MTPGVFSGGLALAFPVAAIPPARADHRIDLTPNGLEHVQRDVVRAYQGVPLAFSAQAGDRLLLRLADAERVLMLQVDPPSGLPWLSGAVPGHRFHA